MGFLFWRKLMDFELTTLCYIEKDDKYLMLHRTKKENDINKDKYIGVGGHMEPNESPDECVVREVKEETGLTLKSKKLRGIITFITENVNEMIFLYTSTEYTGTMLSCDEGELEWVDKNKVCDLPIWEGDKVFFDLLNKREDVFELKLVYEKDILIEVYIDGQKQ